MQYRQLGKTDLQVSRLSFGASSLGGVFHDVQKNDAIRAVHIAIDGGINYFDVAPAYGGTRSESILGEALRGIPRDRYILSTKVGKYTNPDKYGDDTFDYSADRIHASLDESAARLGTDYFDIVHLHDFEYQHGRHIERALGEGLSTLHNLKRIGRIGAVGCGIYPMSLWDRVFRDADIDAAVVHNHYCLCDTRLLELLPMAREKMIGIINASPFAMGLLTDRGPHAWHPASAEDRAIAKAATDFCHTQGNSLGKLAMQFASQHPDIPTIMFSSANPESVRQSIQWQAEPLDRTLADQVRAILRPILDKQWS